MEVFPSMVVCRVLEFDAVYMERCAGKDGGVVGPLARVVS